MDDALRVVRLAKRNRQSLTGVGFYARKLLDLRAKATGLFRLMATETVGDATALADMIDVVFGDGTDQKKRTSTAKELLFALQTEWRSHVAGSPPAPHTFLFPPNLLAQTRRGYLATIGRQVEGCYSGGHYDACAVMMRRLVEVAIIEAFEAKGRQAAITDAGGDYKDLTILVNATISESSWHLSRFAKPALPRLKNIGHLSAHGRSFTAQPSDIERVREDFRLVVEELLRIAGLL